MIFLILFRLLNLNGKRPVAVFGDRQGKRLHVKQAIMLHCRFPQPGRVCARARGEAASPRALPLNLLIGTEL
jgi:hypothetical protein